jgi:hypothetical protein
MAQEASDGLLKLLLPDEAPNEAWEFVTLQVGMIGSNGWVLASDTLAYDPFPLAAGEQRLSAPVLSPVVSKIVHVEVASLVYGYAGGELARIAGIALEEKANAQITPGQRMKDLTEISITAPLKRPDLRPDGGLILIFYRPQLELWAFQLGHLPQQYARFAFGGGGNLAMYWTQRFYDPAASIESLKFLAAHTILEGHHCNPSFVKGLELWSGSGGRVAKAPEKELSELAERSAGLHAELLRLV